MMEKLLYLLKDREYTITEDNHIVLSYPQKDKQYKYEIVIEILDDKNIKVSHYSIFSTMLLEIKTCSKEDVIDTTAIDWLSQMPY
jgi:hypothetical protein